MSASSACSPKMLILDGAIYITEKPPEEDKTGP
jgi:hypothetical protein